MPPAFIICRATNARAIGITSIGSGNLPSVRDELRLVDDADEAPRRARKDLLARQRAAAAFHQMQVLRRLVGAVDVEIELADVGERGDLDSRGLEPARRALGARDDGRELGRVGREPVDQEVNGAARADAERDTVLDVGQRRESRRRVYCLPGSLRLLKKRPPEKRVPATRRALHLCEPEVRLQSPVNLPSASSCDGLSSFSFYRAFCRALLAATLFPRFFAGFFATLRRDFLRLALRLSSLNSSS